MFDIVTSKNYNFITSTIDFKEPLFLENNEYLPIVCLLGKENIANNAYSKLNDFNKYEILKYLKIYAIGVCKTFNFNESGYYLNESQMNVLKKLIKTVTDYLIFSLNLNITMPVCTHSRSSYEVIKNSFFNNFIRTYKLQSMGHIISGKGFIFEENTSSLLMSIVFKTELAKYHKLYYLTTGKFDYANMEFWINRNIDTPKYINKGFRKMYNGMIKPVIKDLNMPIVMKDNIDKLLRASFEIPQNSIAELETWKSNLLSDFLKKEKESITFNFG